MKTIFNIIAVICIVGTTTAQSTLFSETFESASAGTLSTGSDLSGWRMGQITASVNAWTISTASALTGSKSLVVSNDGGTTASYTTTDNCGKVAYYNTLINATNYNTLLLNFNYKSNGETNYDYGQVCYSTDGSNWTLLATKYQGTTSTTAVTNLSLSVCDGTSFYIGFYWINDASLGSNPGFIVDDITMTGYLSPSVQASSFTSSAIGTTTMTVGWTRGNGDAGVVVVARAAGAVNTDVVNGTNYTASATYGSGTQVGTGNYVVYKGTGTSVNLSGLTAGTVYHFAIYEYNSSGTCFNYTQLTGNATTLGAIAIGSGTTDSRYHSVGGYYGYSRSASIYTSSEIGNTNVSITDIAWQVASTGTGSMPFKIYLATTSASEVTADTWANKIGSATLVYNSSYTFNATGWVSFDITDFTYSSNNLLVLVETNYGGTGAGAGGYPYFETTSGSTGWRAWFADNSAPTDNGTTSSTYGYRPNIKVTTASVCSSPDSQATSLTSSSIAETTMTVGWTRGNGDGGVVVVARAGGAINADVVSGTNYTANAAFGSGTQVGTGNYVVYKGTGTSVNLTGLTGVTTYHFAVYEYNSSSTCFNITELTGNATTICTAPTTQATTYAASSVAGTTATVSWTRGNGDAGVLVVLKSGGVVNSDAVNGTNYTANAAFGSGTQIGTGNYVVYKGTGTSVNVTGLTANTTYYFAAFEYNTSCTCFNTTELTGSFTTANPPATIGYFVSGNIVMNGTLVQTNDVNYLTMNGTSKSITGSGTYTDVKLYSNGTITFDGTISSGTVSKTYVESTKTFTVNTSKTYKNVDFWNYGTTTLSSGSTFQNSGNWTNNGTVTANATSTATFNGGAAQTIGGSAVTTFYNATIANTSGDVALGINSTVQNTLTLTSGKFSIQGYTLTIGTTSVNGSVSGGSSSTYIVAYDNSGTIGYLKEFVNSNTAYSYPIGDATNYTPLTFTLTANGGLSSAYLTVFTKDVKVPGLNSSITTYLDRYWDVTESGFTSPTYTMSYIYVDADIVGSETAMLPIKKSGSTWYKPTGSSFTNATEQGTGSFNAGTNTLTWSGLTTFSGFGGVPDGIITLPIELISFEGVKDGKNNLLTWVTTSEQNNDFFTIEKTTDGENFEIVGTENGAGNSTQYLEYSLTDYNVREVINYYRLKQTDFDGKYTFSNIISIDNRTTTSDKEIIMITNILGQEVNEHYRGVVVILYSDGTSKKVIQ